MELQSVSAGSGKTFHLAKIYIRDFLTTHRDVDASHARPDDIVREGTVRRYVLRQPENIIDAHSHILAITFTNKATSEMKERIVDKLADLARGHQLKKDKHGNYKDAEYMDFFLTTTVTQDGEPPTKAQVMATAKAALEEILNCYTDFNISTIDAFFQQLLRTFAYELDLNDNLELSLDNDYLTSAGIDMTLRSANRTSDPNHRKAADWVRKLIENCQERAAKWDILSSKPSNESSLHKELSHIVKKAMSEKIKDLFGELRNYFRSTNLNGSGLNGTAAFNEYYKQIQKYYHEKTVASLTRLGEKIAAYEDALKARKFDQESFTKGVLTVINAARDFNINEIAKKPVTLIFGKMCETTEDDVAVVFKSKAKLSSEARQAVGIAAIRIAKEMEQFLYLQKIEKAIVGHLYYVGLLGMIADNMENFRENNNLLPLSDTNSILSKVVESQADAPFIFERLGSMLNHFLIDEFQDTSRSQWDIMKPLLENTESQSYDNLIIGDAKQSIYRFRDAEPELIISGVKKDFPFTNSRAHAMPNKNWRSSSTVVDFNNTLFRLFADEIDREITLRKGFNRHSPLPIYINVAQQIRHSDKEGYVEVSFEKTAKFNEELGTLITSLLDEGWHQRDIAILCDRNAECKTTIRALLDYNRSDAATKIEIVSEEALSVMESTAVKMILAVLSLIAEGNLLPTSKNSKGVTTPYFSSQAMEIYATMQVATGKAANVTDIDPQGMRGVINPERVDAMLASMPAISLPALVDAIVASPDFIPRELRKTEAAYIAAFQDAVVDFCERYPADPASFMAWWKDVGYKVNLAAPEGADAVTVTTVHKSKGLEFGVVIIPEATWKIDISKREDEIIWVKPSPQGCDDPRIIPPVVPVSVGTSDHEMIRSPYAAEYLEEYDRSRIDKLNEAYVAFTRAGGELYVNCELTDSARKAVDSGKKLPSPSLGGYLYKLLQYMAQENPDKYTFEDEVFKSGTRGVAVRYDDFHKAAPSMNDDDLVKEYYVNSPMPKLRAIAGDDEQGTIGALKPAPRVYGVLLHDVMSGMKKLSDLDRNIRRFRVRGLLSAQTAEKCRAKICEALEIPEVKSWFADDVSVINERKILRGTEKAAIPDRVIDTGSEIIIIDYKTGRDDQPEKYFSQLRKYMTRYEMAYKRAGETRKISGRLLFIPADSSARCRVVEVTREDVAKAM